MPVSRDGSPLEASETFTVSGTAWEMFRDLAERTETAPETLLNEAIHFYAVQLLLAERALTAKLKGYRSRRPADATRERSDSGRAA